MIGLLYTYAHTKKYLLFKLSFNYIHQDQKNLLKNTPVFEKWKKILFFFSELNFKFVLVILGKTKKKLFISKNINLKELSELNNDFVSLCLETSNDFYWFSITFSVIDDANEKSLKLLLNLDKLPLLIKYNNELRRPGWGITYRFLIKSNKPIFYESDNKKITCATFPSLQFFTKAPDSWGDYIEIIYPEIELNWIELNWESTNLKINLSKDYIYYKIIGRDSMEYFKCILGKHKKIREKEFDLLSQRLPKHLIL